ncbi:MAG: hypothetical protein M0Z95_10870 [Actinomycetota bacterium]|jgi:hypothetical protein|nr:hypothetical protein [Actinomycetota bacterium]
MGSRRSHLSNVPGRVAAGTFILNSGMGKLRADKDTAERVHQMAVGAYPMLDGIEARKFVKLLGVAEVALGGALLLPVVGDGVAGAALTAFAGGLLGLYAKTPILRIEGSIRPSQQGTAIAKDVWLLGIGCSLMVDGLQGALGRRAQARAARQGG